MHHEHSLALGEFLVEISTVKKKTQHKNNWKKITTEPALKTSNVILN